MILALQPETDALNSPDDLPQHPFREWVWLHHPRVSTAELLSEVAVMKFLVSGVNDFGFVHQRSVFYLSGAKAPEIS